MDWSSPGDVHKRFKLFKQKCELIFDGPLEEKKEDIKVDEVDIKHKLEESFMIIDKEKSESSVHSEKPSSE